jgi:hypothetical protein
MVNEPEVAPEDRFAAWCYNPRPDPRRDVDTR